MLEIFVAIVMDKTDKLLAIADLVSEQVLGGELGWERLDDEKFRQFCESTRKYLLAGRYLLHRRIWYGYGYNSHAQAYMHVFDWNSSSVYRRLSKYCDEIEGVDTIILNEFKTEDEAEHPCFTTQDAVSDDCSGDGWYKCNRCSHYKQDIE